MASELIPRATRLKLGLRIIELIEENIANGVDRFGNPFEPYSDRPFARPVGGIPKAALKALTDRDAVEFFRREGAAHWVVIKGGYIDLKRAINPAWDGSVDLSGTGEMLRQLAVLDTSNDQVTIGFLTDEAAEIAFYHTVQGAGKSRVIRDFLGITDEQFASLDDVLDEDGGVNLEAIISR